MTKNTHTPENSHGSLPTYEPESKTGSSAVKCAGVRCKPAALPFEPVAYLDRSTPPPSSVRGGEPGRGGERSWSGRRPSLSASHCHSTPSDTHMHTHVRNTHVHTHTHAPHTYVCTHRHARMHTRVHTHTQTHKGLHTRTSDIHITHRQRYAGRQ